MAFVGGGFVAVSRGAPSRARRVCKRPPVAMTQDAAEELHLVIFAVPPRASLLTPGETRAIDLPYSTFHEILSSGSTLFAQVYAGEWARDPPARPRGALLSIQSARKVDRGGGGGCGGAAAVGGAAAAAGEFPPAPPVVTAEVACTGRADILHVAGSGPAGRSDGPVMRGMARRVRDGRPAGHRARAALAAAEWEAWAAVGELGALQARLGAGVRGEADVDKELRVWAPREYDREVTEAEWRATPATVREVWQARAEALSFAMLRRCGVGGADMGRAMHIVRTDERLAMCVDELRKATAVALAQLSIDGAFAGGDDGAL